MYFCHIENFAYGEINERSFSNPHPRAVQDDVMNIYVTPLTAPNTETLHQANDEVQQGNINQYSVYCP